MIELKIEGMTCQHCVRAVMAAVQSVLPGAEVSVDLETGIVRIPAGRPSDVPPIETAIVEEGYTIRHATTA